MSLLRFPYRKASRAAGGILTALFLAYAAPLASHAQQSGTAMVFYAQPRVSEELWPDLFASLRSDLAAGIGQFPNGLGLDQNATFLRGNDLPEGIDFSNLIEVELLGRCDVLPQANRSSREGPLGWVLRVSGKIQPYIFVDCTRIAQDLRMATAGLDQQGREHEMTQAIAHVVIHEWIHIATQSPSHGAKGITKQFLSVDELIADPNHHRLLTAAH